MRKQILMGAAVAVGLMLAPEARAQSATVETQVQTGTPPAAAPSGETIIIERREMNGSAAEVRTETETETNTAVEPQPAPELEAGPGSEVEVSGHVSKEVSDGEVDVSGEIEKEIDSDDFDEELEAHID